MRYLVSIHHPAQVHFFRPIVDELVDIGHDVRVCAREKDVTGDLLEAFDVPHRMLAQEPDSVPGIAATQATYELRLLREAWRFQPDVVTSIGGIEISHVAPLVGAKSLAFDDTSAPAARLLTSPFLDVVCTPATFDQERGPGQRRYEGYHELAYLHPDRFEPDPGRLREFGVDPESRFSVLRFAAWNAYHDVGERGLSLDAKRQLLSELAKHGDVFITSEQELPPEFESYRTPVPPHVIHDLLAFADLYVGDSGTMATEAAVLGTPAVRSNSAVEGDDLPNFVELEEEYGLLYSFADEAAMLDCVESIASRPEVRETFQRRRKRLLEDKIDVTSYAVDQLEQLGRQANDDGTTTSLARIRSWLRRDEPSR